MTGVQTCALPILKANNGDAPDMSETYGYAPRYSEYKTSYDRYNGSFGNSLKSWVTGINFDFLKDYFLYPWSAISAPNMFLCRPDIVKNIFACTWSPGNFTLSAAFWSASISFIFILF